jgi:ribosomal protein S18 acetylase RimI-like enzyme
MDSKVLIREAQAGELAAVEALVKGAYREFRELVPEEGWERWMASITQALQAGEGLLLVAEVEGAIQGAVQFFPDASRSRQGQWPAGAATIRLLAVRPEARGRGLGTLLTQECLRRARALNSPTIYLYTGRFMLAAQRIYEKLGFQRAPEYDPPQPPGPIAYRVDLSMRESSPQ